VALKKAAGLKLGNRTDPDDFAANIRPAINSMQEAELSSYEGIATALNARGLKTRCGGRWRANTVRNLLHRI
jgi:hypothetical protein